MKIIFCSNFMNHHQLYFSLAMLEQGIEYYFIANEEICEERKVGGWVDMNSKYDWIIRAYEGKEQLIKAKKLIYDADLVIAGSFPMKYLRKRIFARKPVFLYSERWFKSTDGEVKQFKTMHNFLSNLLHRKYLNFFKVYMLCASAYTSYDCSLYNNFKNKCYKWGYFPYVSTYDINQLINKKQNSKVELLWVARMLDWKHPEYPIALAKQLKSENIDFHINMIGVGPELEKVEQDIKKYGLDKEVTLLGSMPTEKVREYMEKSNIFLFTSDFNEGWGAVLNEAMNSGCAVVASQGIGSVPFLIKDGQNGMIYNYGDIEEFIQKTKILIEDKDLREILGKQAYLTLVNEWNPQNAAKKLLMLYDKLILKKNINIQDGVCSKAEIIDKDWRKK